MAKGLTRAPALIGGVLFIAITALYLGLPPRNSAAPSFTPAVRATFRLRRVERAIDSIELAEGGARRLFALGRRSPGLSVVSYDDSIRRPVSGTVGAAFDFAWARLPAHVAGESLLVRVGAPFRSARVLRPGVAGPGLCISRGGVPDTSTGAAGAASDVGLSFGPCAYYVAFGRPGPAVGRWLAGSPMGTWTGAPGFRGGLDSTDWNANQRRMWRDAGWILRASRADLPPAYASPGAAGCDAGRLPVCEKIGLMATVLDPFWDEPAFGTGLGPVSGGILPAMVSDFGAERFKAFWQSKEEVPQAFETAFGVPFGEWIHGQVRAYYGPLEIGAGDTGRAALSALLWTTVFLALTALLARRLRY